MRIGVVSDTHGHLPGTQSAVRMLESLQVEAVLHCGDIGTADVVDAFSKWPTHFVFGNCDYDQASLRQAIESAGQTCHGACGTIELAGRRIAMLHGDRAMQYRQLVDSGEYDLICSGHTHQAASDRQGETVLLNPGAIYRANPPTIAVVELPQLEATIVPL